MRVLLVDDHPVVRVGLKALLDATEGMEVVGEASSGEEALRRVRTLEPDIVVMDLAMPGMDGIRATRRITELGLGAKVLVLTVHDEDEFLLPAVDAGAVGFLNKSVADTDLVGAIEAINHGHSYLPRQAAGLLARRKTQGNSNHEAELNALSSRERTAIKWYARGLSATETGKEMFVSPKTVESYLARARRKLGVRKRRDIVDFALDAGLLPGGDDRQG